MYQVHFIKEALWDVEDILFWYEEQRKGLSYDFELCFEAGIDEIIRSPDSFQKKYKSIRIKYIARFPYGIHYMIKGDSITNIGIFHTSRTPKNWAKRL
ncbi:MAG: addiction module toxin RelE [Flavobacterium sp. BFFFF1]|nr:MAG: addiction module toxin RelE [Flavobacterium sp. BFFFF1]